MTETETDWLAKKKRIKQTNDDDVNGMCTNEY